MVVRQAVGRGLRPAGRIGGVAGRGPHIGAQEPAAAAAVEKEDLRRIAVRRELIRIARLEFGDDAIGEEAAVARKAGKEVGALRPAGFVGEIDRSEEHTSELQALMRLSYPVLCLKKKK